MLNQSKNVKHPLHDHKERKTIHQHQRPSCNSLIPRIHFFSFFFYPHPLILPNPLGHWRGYLFHFDILPKPSRERFSSQLRSRIPAWVGEGLRGPNVEMSALPHFFSILSPGSLSHFFFLKTHQRKYSNRTDCRASTATNDGFCTFILILSSIQL